MRIIHLVNQNSRVCGYTRRTAEIVQAQRSSGLQPEVICITDGQFVPTRFQQVLSAASRIACMREAVLLDAVLQTLIMATLMIDGLDHALLRGPKPSVLHAHTPWPCALAASIIAREHGIPWVSEIRGIQEESAIVNTLHKRDSAWFEVWQKLETWSRGAASEVMAISPALADDAYARGARRVTLTPNAVDAERFYPDFRGASSSPAVGYIGSITQLEGVTSLVENFSHIQQRVPRAHCVIVGDGTGRAGLETLAQEHPESRVSITGPIPPEDVPAAFRAMDCIVISRPDTLVTRVVTPLKPLESLASGTPVVSSDLPALRYVGEAGTVFYPPGDGAGMADAVHAALARREQLGREGRDWVVRDRTWAQVVALQREVYERVRA